MSRATAHLRALVPALAALVALALAASAQADYGQVGLFGQSGSGEQLLASNGVAVNTTGAGGVEAGSVYAASPERISRYNAKGEFKEAWGWETIASGPDLPNQVNTLKVNAGSGGYELAATTGAGAGESTAGSKGLTGVRTLVGAFRVGDTFRKDTGTGNITVGSNTVTEVSGLGISQLGKGSIGLTISGKGIPPNTTVTAFSFVEETPKVTTLNLTLSQAATETRSKAPLTGESFVTAVGTRTLELSAEAPRTSFNGPQSISATETTASIPYNASAAEVKAALVALPAFGPGDVSVTGTPGNYEITFEGAYAGSPIEMSSTESTLAGGSPSSATVATVVSPHGAPPHFERCRVENGDVCALEGFGRFHQEDIGRFMGLQGVAVDQSTGYVYVLNEIEYGHIREHNLIEVFNADGTEVIARFGDAAVPGKTFEEEPEKLHKTPSGKAGIAVDDSGKIYLTDNSASPSEARVMCFRPESPGDYEHYVYCGRSQDIPLKLVSSYFENVSYDNASHVYAASVELISEFSAAQPAAPPLCTWKTNGQLRAMTVNPQTGEVFYYNASGNDLAVHRLKPCNPAKGKFEEAQARVKGVPPMIELKALAINPSLSWGPNRPPGVLYGTDAKEHETETPNYRGLGYIFAPAEVLPPTIESESVSNTRTGSTILHAKINPHGFGTRYVFQYLTEAQYEANDPGERFAGAMEAPAGGGEIGGGSVGEAATAISGLTPDTAYRFRVIASSECDTESGEPCVVEGEALAFATYPLFPPGLPDHRVYELVSPAQKHGGEVIPAYPSQASCGSNCKPSAFGNVFPMQSSPDGEALAYEGQPFTPFEGAINYDSYVARRTSSGWQSTALIPALPPGRVSQLAFDASLEQGLLDVQALGSERANLEIQKTAEPGSTIPLMLAAPPNRTTSGPNAFRHAYGGHSADFTRQLFAANDTLTKATAFAPEPPDPGAAKDDLYEWHEGQLAVINVAPGNATVMAGASFASISPDTHAVSEDGSRVFWKSEAGNLYVRIDGEETKQINDPGHFLSASPDGSEVLLDDGCLYSLEAEACIDLTEGRGGFQGLVGQSKDFSHLYFVDTAVLAENEGAGLDSTGNPQVAEAGEGNLYSLSEGETRFIAQLAVQNLAGGIRDTEDWAADPAARTAEASPNGRFLAFTSLVALTDYDNVGFCGRSGGETLSIPCREAFLYDSSTGSLTCASCNPTGEAPLGNTTLRRIGEPAPVEEFPQPRYLTDEGRLYFDTQDSLSARDTNEGVEDVYEFTPQGAGAQGTCNREAGCAFLISAGTEPVDSNLIAVDETGKNVFFDTRDKLSLKDKDELLDVYDAREGGGIAAESEIARAECQGENCQPPVTPPNDPTPASSSFEGAGNVKEAPAAKKHAKKKHKHAKKHKKAKKHAKQARTAKRNHGGAK